MAESKQRERKTLEAVEAMLGLAVFSPAHLHDWLAFCFGQPALLGLEEEEAFDLFARAAIAAETIHPEIVEGRDPLAWLWSLDDPQPVLAQALGSLRADRPYLFHRALYSLPAVSRGLVNPEEHELLEDFLAQALGEGAELSEAAGGEIKALRERALRAAGLDPEKPHPQVAALAEQVLEKSLEAGLETDSELLAWLARGDGLEGVEDALAPAVMAEV